MHKHLSSRLSKKPTRFKQEDLSPWNEAVLEAKNQIEGIEREAKIRIARLVDSIKTFEALRDSGARFPESKERNAA